ncbi:MAG TPA: beta-ketoacyl synthase N-terminal-like domain-containing protein [Flavitalea sp.]|nr:beta-ketoacyl synthase N-terminal-like domain-containing protein [Flavitalea sp.]
MMREVFIVSDNIISPLGFTTEKNFYQLRQNKSAIECHIGAKFSAQPFYASLLSDEQNDTLNNAGVNGEFTKFEKLLINSIKDAVMNTEVDVASAETIVIISTTKGNISLLETEANSPRLQQRIALHNSARVVAEHFKNPNKPVVVSNACISGLTAMLTGKRLIQSGKFRHAVVAGADVISKFILSGFQSFQAVSDKPCRPFDANRNGVTLGEAAATVVLSSGTSGNQKVKFLSGAVSNDANHISGPSRTGEELCIAVNKSLKQAGLAASDIGFVSAHGTATIYNDEMEAKAFSLANLEAVPVNSLKGYYGHTLGAAGIVESIVSIHALQSDIILPTAGFERSGVSSPINICDHLQPVKGAAILKTASGFGGCNAALVFQKSYS